MGQPERPVLNSWFLLRNYDNANLERWETWCDADETMGVLVNRGNVDETVQRVDGVLVIDAKAIHDSMYGGPSGPQATEEKRIAIEMMGIQEGMRRQNAIPRWCHGEVNLSDGHAKETAKIAVGTFLWRWMCMES